MLIITIHVNRPLGQAIGIKEAIAQDLEAKYRDVHVVSVEDVTLQYDQMSMGLAEGRNETYGKQ